MDYTTLALVKEAIRTTKATDDALLTRLVTAASRATDRLCGQSDRALNYFLYEAVSAEELTGKTDVQGRITCWPHKSIIASVSAMQYKFRPLQDWQTVDPNILTVNRGHEVVAWTNFTPFNRGDVMLKVTYIGGHATLAYPGGSDPPGSTYLPADLVEAVTVLAARFYREDESGLTDSVGVAELGTLTYTKSFPVRVKDTLSLYTRRMPW